MFDDRYAKGTIRLALAATDTFGGMVGKQAVMIADRLGYDALGHRQIIIFIDAGYIDAHRAGGTMAAIHAMPLPGKFLHAAHYRGIISFCFRGGTPG